MTERHGSRSRALIHWKPNGSKQWTFGLYEWSRPGGGGKTRHHGYVVRLGPLGHVQWQTYRKILGDGRRPLRSVQVSKWGTSGRRRKRSVRVDWTGK